MYTSTYYNNCTRFKEIDLITIVILIPSNLVTRSQMHYFQSRKLVRPLQLKINQVERSLNNVLNNINELINYKL